MKILIPFSSKLSNSFSDSETKVATAVSLGTIQESIKSKKVVINENDSFEDILFKINEVHPNFKYNPISKNTVLGVVSRLLGEVRYLDKILDQEDDHIINKLKDKIEYHVHDRTLSNEIIRLTTPEKEVQNNGAGIVKESAKEHILLSKNELSTLFYSVFNLTDLSLIEEFINVISQSKDINSIQRFFDEKKLNYNGKFELFCFLNSYNEHANKTKSYDKAYRDTLKKAEKENEELETLMSENTVRYMTLLKKLGHLNKKDESAYFQPKFIVLSGLLIYTLVDFIISIGLRKELLGKLIEEKNNIKGIAVFSGGLTIKDFYSAFVEKKKTTNDSPYFLSSKFFDKKENGLINQSEFKIGVTKEDGLLEININVSEEEAVLLKEQIKNVGVSTFQLGKKGLAYVREINIFE